MLQERLQKRLQKGFKKSSKVQKSLKKFKRKVETCGNLRKSNRMGEIKKQRKESSKKWHGFLAPGSQI